MPTLTSAALLDQLRADVRGQPTLPALSGERYARTHAAYEAASDQRSKLQTWLCSELPPLLAGRDPVRVTGVGVGDGSIDAPLARALAASGRQVHYTGIEPHAPSAAAFAGRLAALDAPGLRPTTVTSDFANHDAHHPVDLLHFVHSLYYVADLTATLDHALSMIRPGGLLLAATAPSEPLCVLTELLCPWYGRGPWFAEDVRAELDGRGLDVRSETIVGHLDVREAVADPLGRGQVILDFLVGARTSAMQPATRERLVDCLRDMFLPGRPGVVPHPVDITIARAP